MRKIAIIGAGSAVFTYTLCRDILTYPELQDSELSLMDIDPDRVGLAGKLAQKLAADRKAGLRVRWSTDRRKALEGADYVLITIMVGGEKVYRTDVEIPARYGVYQCIADTIGPGGVFRYLRTAPVLRSIVRDVREVAAPGALIINYANPMAMNCWGILDEGFPRLVGLCHSIPIVAGCIADWIGVPRRELVYTAGGINHVNFYLRLEHEGRDVYPDLLAAESKILASGPDRPSLKSTFELMKALGYWAAETGFHQTEYYPWFRKNEKSGEEYSAPNFLGYRQTTEGSAQWAAEFVPKLLSGETPIDWNVSEDYGSRIMHANVTGTPRVIYGNLRNNGLIENLPPEAVVEVPCVAGAAGLTPCRVGRIPEALAAVMRAHISVHELAVKGSLHRDKRLVEQAIMLDPLTAAVGTLPRIRQMVTEMFAANRDHLADWR